MGMMNQVAKRNLFDKINVKKTHGREGKKQNKMDCDFF